MRKFLPVSCFGCVFVSDRFCSVSPIFVFVSWQKGPDTDPELGLSCIPIVTSLIHERIFTISVSQLSKPYIIACKYINAHKVWRLSIRSRFMYSTCMFKSESRNSFFRTLMYEQVFNLSDFWLCTAFVFSSVQRSVSTIFCLYHTLHTLTMNQDSLLHLLSHHLPFKEAI